MIKLSDGGVAIAAARVAIDFVDELPNGRAAIADDVGRLAAGGGDEAVADDQHPVVVAGGEVSTMTEESSAIAAS